MKIKEINLFNVFGLEVKVVRIGDEILLKFLFFGLRYVILNSV